MKAPKRKSKYQIIVRGRADSSGSHPLPHKPPRALRPVAPLPAKHASWRDVLRYSEAVFFALLYIVATTAEVSLIKGLNYAGHITLPIFTAIVLNQAWLVMIPGYIATYRHARSKKAASDAKGNPAKNGPSAVTAPQVQAQRSTAGVQGGAAPEDGADEVVMPLFIREEGDGVQAAPAGESRLCTTAHQRATQASEPSHTSLLKAYVGMGVIVYCVTMSRNYATNLLPGSTAALLMASSMVWNVLLSKLLLKRRFKLAHYGAAAAGMAGIICLGAEAIPGLNPEDPGPSSPPAGSSSRSSLAIGLSAGAASGVFIALMSVTSSMVTKAWKKHRNLRVTEMTLFSSLIAVLLLIPTGWAVQEYGTWREQIGQAMGMPGRAKLTVILLTLAMPFNKAIVRSSKHATISHSSAFLFEFVQATAGITAAVVNILLFGEAWSYGIIASVLLLSLGSVLYLIARRQEEADVRKSSPLHSNRAAAVASRQTTVSTGGGLGGRPAEMAPLRRPAWALSTRQQRWAWTSGPGSPAPAPARTPGKAPSSGLSRPLLASPTGFMHSNLLQTSADSSSSMPYGGPFALGVRHLLWPATQGDAASSSEPPPAHVAPLPFTPVQEPLPLPGITATGAIGPSEDLADSPAFSRPGQLLVYGSQGWKRERLPLGVGTSSCVAPDREDVAERPAGREPQKPLLRSDALSP